MLTVRASATLVFEDVLETHSVEVVSMLIKFFDDPLHTWNNARLKISESASR